MARRSLELGAGFLTWENAGGKLLFGTLTMRHHVGHRLVGEWEALQRAWDSIIRSRVWKKWLQRLGCVGLVRVVEVTYGDANGWHVHLHFVACVGADGELSGDLLDGFTGWLYGKWRRALAGAGWEAGALDRAQDVHLVDSITAATRVGEYLAKSTAYGAAESLGRELMGSATKRARKAHGTEAVWTIAERFAGCGNMALLDLWHEYERGSKGKRQCTWSRGLRDRLGLGQEASDEEIAGEVVGDKDLLQITAEGWSRALQLAYVGVPTSRILDAAEAGGADGLRRYLTDHGIEYQEVS